MPATASDPLHIPLHFTLQRPFEVGAISILQIRKLRYEKVKQLSMIILVLKPVPKLRVCHPQNHVPNHGSSLPFYKNLTLNLKHVKNMQPCCWQHLVAPSTGCRYSLQANAGSLCSWGSDAKGLDFSFLTSHTRVYPVSPPTGWTAVQFWHSPRELVSHTTSYRLRSSSRLPLL